MNKRIALTLTWKRLIIAGAVLAALPFAVSLSGLVSIAASSGHFAPVGWFLHWTMQNAVDRQSLGISVPEGVDLSDPALVQRAAGHFATGCAPCHGAPGVAQSPVVLSMMPYPPRLQDKVPEWKDRELFWILKHGIKYSGMPAWPTQQREDEVWAQVAFLRALPGMSPETYADLALGGARPSLDLQAGAEQTAALTGVSDDALADCARCHGRDGMGRSGSALSDKTSAGAFPIIAGQPEAYLFATLQAYAKGFRHSGFMQPPASRYDETVLADLAAWYAKQPVPGRREEITESESGEAPAAAEAPAPAPVLAAAMDGIPPQIFPADNRAAQAIAPSESGGAGGTPDDPLALGRLIAVQGIAARKLPACDNCHSAEGRKKNPLYPYLGGQPEWYVTTHLELWRDHAITRGGTRFSHVMTPIATNMTDAQIEAVAAWYSSRPVGE